MSLYIQYHNADKEGLRYFFSNDGRLAIYTRRSHVQKARGTVFLIVGVGKPRQYFLWESFDIDHVEAQEDGTFLAEGPGFRLCPPQRLEGDDFNAFKSSCANFVGFRKIDDLPYSITLKKLAERFHRPASAAMIPFLRELLGLLKVGTDDHEIVLNQLSQQGGRPIADKKPNLPKPDTRKPVQERLPSKSTIWFSSSPKDD
jgi:hypothetical protein